MGKNKKHIKIRLKGGDKLEQIIQFIQDVKTINITFVLDDNFNALMHESFLNTLKKECFEYKKEIIFMTQKKYFQKVLAKKNFEVSGYEDDDKEILKAQTLAEYFGKIQAVKNEKIKVPQNPNTEKKTEKKSIEKDFSTKKIESSAQEKSFRGVVFFLFVFMILGIGSVYLLVTPKATITVKPRISSIETTQNIIINLADSKIPSTEITLPKVSGILVETEIEDTETFPSTGRNYEVSNAYGKVRLYNETSTKKYIVPSRLSTNSGVVVRTQEPATIPPRKDGKAGFIDVDVIADKFKENGKPIGNLGNLDPDTELFFPALLPETRKLFYARTKLGPLVGGSTLTKYFIAPSDFENATEILKETFAIRATEKLKKELQVRSDKSGKHYIFIEHPQLLKTELLSSEYDKELIGKDSETLSIKAKMRISGLVFDQDDILEIMKKKLKTTQDHRKEIIRIDPQSVEYQIMKTQDFQEDNWTKISISVTGIEALNFSKENIHAQKWVHELKSEILGKTVSHARSILLNRSEIEKIVSIDVAPFWTKTLPHLTDRVKLKVQY